LNQAFEIAANDQAPGRGALGAAGKAQAPLAYSVRGTVKAEFTAPAELASLSEMWRDLVEHSVEQNPFYAPWMLMPALARLNGAGVQIACVFEEYRGDRRLVGLAPFSVVKSFGRLPMTILSNWKYEHCFFGAPLVRRGCAQAFFDSLFALIEKHPARPALMRLSHMRVDGPLIMAARSSAESVGRYAWQADRYERAQLCGPISAEDYISQAIRKKKRKELNRLRNRLSETGLISFFRLEKIEQVEGWTKLFLSIESGGWKGKALSALASSKASAEFFKAAIAGAFDEGALRFYRLDVGERTIAMIVNFLNNGEGHSFKICHDEAFSRYSPGVLLELEMLKAIEQEAGFVFYDSCAAADHPMINGLWRDRAQIGAFNVGRTGAGAGALLRAVRGLENLSSRYRSISVTGARSRK